MSVFIGFLIGIIAFLLFVLKSKGDEIKHLEEQLYDLRIRLTRNNEFAETYRKKELPTDSNYAVPVEEDARRTRRDRDDRAGDDAFLLYRGKCRGLGQYRVCAA